MLAKESLDCEYHGTGDTFNGVFVGAHLNDRTLLEALELAHQFVYACVKESACYEYEERGRSDYRKESCNARIK